MDEAIFNALTGGNAMFKSTFKVSMAAKASTVGAQDTFSFPLVKAGVKLQVEVARDQIDAYFKQAGVSDDAMTMLADAGATYSAQVAQASDVRRWPRRRRVQGDDVRRQDSMQGSIVETGRHVRRGPARDDEQREGDDGSARRESQDRRWLGAT